jgi:hypothetical protein
VSQNPPTPWQTGQNINITLGFIFFICRPLRQQYITTERVSTRTEPGTRPAAPPAAANGLPDTSPVPDVCGFDPCGFRKSICNRAETLGVVRCYSGWSAVVPSRPTPPLCAAGNHRPLVAMVLDNQATKVRAGSISPDRMANPSLGARSRTFLC